MSAPAHNVDQLQNPQPNAVCDGCKSVRNAHDAFCGDCGSQRPLKGWTAITAFGDPFLGRALQDRWFVVQRVGKGSTGAVYRAESLRLPRTFALKIVDLDHGIQRTREENLRSAQREVDVVRRLRSPHIISCYELLTLDDGYVGMVMDFVAGSTMRALVEEVGPLHPEKAIELVRQVAIGLQAAHEAGVVHCDVKPENILVEKLPCGDDFVRITDFGIAALGGEQFDRGGFVGTPLWASPEQIRGDDIDGRADLYSLGALLYFLLTGQAPFSSDDYRAVLEMHVLTQAPRLSDAGIGEFPQGLEQLVAALLRKNPDARPRTMLEVVKILDELNVADWEGRPTEWSSAVQDMRESSETISHTHPEPPPQPKGVCLRPFAIETGSPTPALGSMRGNRIATTSNTRLHVTTLVPPRTFTIDVEIDARSVAVTDQGALVGTQRGTIERLAVGHEPETLFRCASGRPVSALATDLAERLIVAGTERGELYVHHAADRQWRCVQTGGPVTAVDVSADGSCYAVARGNVMEIYMASDNRSPIGRIAASDIHAISLAADGHLVATLGPAGMVRIWEVETGRRVYSMMRTKGRILALAFLPETLLGLCEEGGETYLLDLQCSECESCAPSAPRCALVSH